MILKRNNHHYHHPQGAIISIRILLSERTTLTLKGIDIPIIAQIIKLLPYRI